MKDNLVIDTPDVGKIRSRDVFGVRTRWYQDSAGEPLVLIHASQVRACHRVFASRVAARCAG